MITAKENISRVMKELGLDNLVVITREESDRVFGWPIGPYLRKFVEDTRWMTEPSPITSMMHGPKSQSFREPQGAHPALQIVFHPFLEQEFSNYEFVEIDLDRSAPVDVVDGIRHLAEVTGNALENKKTDQEEIKRMLDKRLG